MPVPIQIDDDAYAIAQAFAEQAHCSVASAVSRLVLKSDFAGATPDGPTTDSVVRFPLVRGARTITSEAVARLGDES